MVGSVHSAGLSAKVFAEGRRTVAFIASIKSFAVHQSPASTEPALLPAGTD